LSLKIGIFLIRFVGESAPLIPGSTPTAFVFLRKPTTVENYISRQQGATIAQYSCKANTKIEVMRLILTSIA